MALGLLCACATQQAPKKDPAAEARAKAAQCPAPPSTSEKPLRVMFIGNSLTAANDLPSMVAALALGLGRPLVAEAVTFNGATLEDHWNDGTAKRRLEKEQYDYVVLQQGPSSVEQNREHLRYWTRRFADSIRQSGAKPALYMVWPARTRPGDFERVRDSYSLAANDVGGTFLPAGEALRELSVTAPDFPLFENDGLHPTAEGSYLAALVIASVLTGSSPRAGPEVVCWNGRRDLDLPPPAMAALRQAASEAVVKYAF